MPKRQSFAGVLILQPKRKWSRSEHKINEEAHKYNCCWRLLSARRSITISYSNIRLIGLFIYKTPLPCSFLYYLVIFFSFFFFRFLLFSSSTSSMRTVKTIVQHTGDSPSSLYDVAKRCKYKWEVFFCSNRNRQINRTDLPFECWQWILLCRQWKGDSKCIPHEAPALAHS